MNSKNEKTFMNVGHSTIYNETRIALKNNEQLLSIFEYIEVTNFKIDTFMLDKFWQCIAENSSVYKKLNLCFPGYK